jgi:hypothetical protein
MLIILLRGFSHSGKDYIGNILCNTYGFTRFAFADSLKKIVSEKYNCELNTLHSQDGKLNICQNDSNNRTYRQILIDEALYLRNVDPDIFAKSCCQEIINSNSKKIVITDWRYPNEFEILQNTFPNCKLFTVYIHRENQTLSPVHDISEYHLIDRKDDYKIINRLDDTIYTEIEQLINFINKSDK